MTAENKSGDFVFMDAFGRIAVLTVRIKSDSPFVYPSFYEKSPLYAKLEYVNNPNYLRKMYIKGRGKTKQFLGYKAVYVDMSNYTTPFAALESRGITYIGEL